MASLVTAFLHFMQLHQARSILFESRRGRDSSRTTKKKKKKGLLFKILKILIRFLHGLIEFNLLYINLGKLFATLFATPQLCIRVL